MPTETTSGMEKLDLLEGKIADAVAVIERLGSRCRTLVEDKEELTRRIDDLERQIADLKARGTVGAAKLLADGKIISKIDRLIEKFGELQV
jgi:hypothetical protein